MHFLTDLSNREKAIWADLILDGVIALNFFPKILRLKGSLADNAEAMAIIVISVVVMAVVGSLLIEWLLDVGDAEKEDERDLQFNAKGHQVGYQVLTYGVIFLIGHVILNDITLAAFSFQYEPLSQLRLITYLFIGLSCAAFAKDLARLFYYRRGY